METETVELTQDQELKFALAEKIAALGAGRLDPGEKAATIAQLEEAGGAICSEIEGVLEVLEQYASLAEDYIFAAIKGRNRTPVGRDAVGVELLVGARGELGRAVKGIRAAREKLERD